jgi:hypothetical protein
MEQYYERGLRCSLGQLPAPLPPHVYTVADLTYRTMMTNLQQGESPDQSILISGESGAGKVRYKFCLLDQLLAYSRVHFRFVCPVSSVTVDT